MTEPDDVTSDADRRLLGALGDALGPEPLPDGLVERARGLITWADVDHELAALLDEAGAEQVGTRGVSVGDVLGFRLADGSIVVEVELDGTALRGSVVGADVDDVELARPDGQLRTAAVDALGEFTFADVAAGPVRIGLRTAGRTIHTDWFVV
jgi:hypothetical protein